MIVKAVEEEWIGESGLADTETIIYRTDKHQGPTVQLRDYL